MKIIIIFFLLVGVAQADCTKPLNEKYSFKDFMNQSFKTVDPSEFNNTCIKGSNFYQEADIDATLEKDIIKSIFPVGMTGVEFVRCNLNNVDLPINNTTDSTSVRETIKVQNDLEDWKLDASLKPLEPVFKERYEKLGLSTKPEDIPPTKQEKPITKE